MAEELVVTPWEVKGKVDYDKLIKQFGTSPITAELEKSLVSVTGEDNIFLRRKLFYSHRDLDKAIADFKGGKGIYLYTGVGPSNPMHIGHLVPFFFTKWLQEKFGVNLYIQVTDDEKFVFKRERTLEHITKVADDDIRNIAAVGFDPDKTFIFKDTEYIDHIYKLALKVSREMNYSQVKSVFGFNNMTNVGLMFFPSLEIVPTMFEKKRCLIPDAIDQDPYWRLQRDMAEKLGYHKAAQIHSKFIPPLTGVEGKMSASKPETAIYLTDDEKTVKSKIMKYAFSGGQESVEMHRKLGGNVDVDVSFLWLRDFFEPDDEKMAQIEKDYRSGKMLTGELKQMLVDKVNALLTKHRANKEKADSAIEKIKYSGKLAQKMWETTFE